MPIVNYVREHVRFMEYASDEHLTAGERQLWEALFHIMNSRATGNVWPEGYIRVSNERVLSYTTMGFDTMAKARNRLKQRGLIDYEAGRRNEISPAYKMNFFYPEENEFYPNNSDKEGGKEWGKALDKTVGKEGDKPGDFILNYTERYTDPYGNREERDEEEELRAHAGAREPGELSDRGRIEREAMVSWYQEVGEDITPALMHRIGTIGLLNGFEPGVVQTAVEYAAVHGKMPAKYLLKILGDWSDSRIHTQEEAERYQYLTARWKAAGPGTPEDMALEAFLQGLKEKYAG